ncbi:unnamed protein product [Rhizophagus irregularis]|nr:unnamed protein product [Rhizophagus irregularis]
MGIFFCEWANKIAYATACTETSLTLLACDYHVTIWLIASGIFFISAVQFLPHYFMLFTWRFYLFTSYLLYSGNNERLI